ncbi:MAG: alpha/beta hydrolase [Desulfurococcales archaeon]|nr:alpha/beta hydrolase [Desulfurococcales archaeon]
MTGNCFVEKTIETTYGNVYVKLSQDSSLNIPIILLHGFSFTSDVWSEIGLLEVLCKEGIPFIAPDMPYGMKVNRSFKSRDPDKNVYLIGEIISASGFDKNYMVGASIGGYISLKYAVEKNNVVGMTLVAPVNPLEHNIILYLRENALPILLIYGENDNVVDLSEMKRFADETMKTRLLVYKEAPHPAYLKSPNRFAANVVGHYKEVIGLF